MVQREVADRFFAEPARRRTAPCRCSSSSPPSAPASTRLAHGVPSAAERRLGARRVPAPRPAPGALRRDQAASSRRVRAPAEDACRTRSRSPASPPASARRRRSRRSAATRGVRAEALEPPEFVALAEALAVRRAPAAAKINLALVVGPQREDGQHEVTTVLQRVDLSTASRSRPRPRSPSTGFADDTIVRARTRARSPTRPASSRAFAATITKRIPVAAGLGGGSSDAATALRLANELLPEPLPPERLQRDRRAARRRRPVLPRAGPAARRGRRARPPPRRAAAGLLGRCSCCRTARRRPRRPTVYAALRRARRRARLRGAPRGAARGARARRAAARPRRAAAERPRRPRRSPTSCARSAPSAPTSPAPARPSTGCSPTARRARPRSALWSRVGGSG